MIPLPRTLQAGLVGVADSEIALVLVHLDFIDQEPGDRLLKALTANFPRNPIMLVYIGPNGYKAHAHFQTARLLTMVQMEQIRFEEIEVGKRADPEEELPF